MPTLTLQQLSQTGSAIFTACGVPADQADIVGRFLATANLVGHDSHGVIRISEYVGFLDKGHVERVAQLEVVHDSGALLLMRGNYGFGQVIGSWAMERAIRTAREHGFAVMGLNQAAHLGRIGDWPTMAVAAGFVSIHFVNTHGGGKIVAPFGGSDRRMSANPFAAGIPVPGRTPVIVDISTSSIAGGKIHVAYNKGSKIPEGCVIDRNGQLTTDPGDFMNGLGALLHFGGHKGFSIGFLCDVLAGALTGAPCSDPRINRVANAMLTILIDPGLYRDRDDFYAEVIRYIDYLKGSPLRPGFGEILYPGEPEERTQKHRTEHGIPIDDATWNEIVEVAQRAGAKLAEDLPRSETGMMA
ncbi:MAG: malate/lactate/ureidoglycolate dehydrogenase [Bryobacteraceae bacterium]